MAGEFNTAVTASRHELVAFAQQTTFGRRRSSRCSSTSWPREPTSCSATLISCSSRSPIGSHHLGSDPTCSGSPSLDRCRRRWWRAARCSRRSECSISRSAARTTPTGWLGLGTARCSPRCCPMSCSRSASTLRTRSSRTRTHATSSRRSGSRWNANVPISREATEALRRSGPPSLSARWFASARDRASAPKPDPQRVVCVQ